MGQSGTSAPDGRLRSPGPRRSGRWCHGQRGEKEPRKGSAHPPFWRRAGRELAPGAWPEHSSPPRGTAEGTQLLFPRGSRTEALQMDAPLRLTLV